MIPQGPEEHKIRQEAPSKRWRAPAQAETGREEKGDSGVDLGGMGVTLGKAEPAWGQRDQG